MLVEVLDRPAKVGEQKRSEIRCNALANQNALNRDVAHVVRQRVGWDLPTAHAQPVRKVEQRVAGIGAVLDPPGDGRNALARPARRPHIASSLRAKTESMSESRTSSR